MYSTGEPRWRGWNTSAALAVAALALAGGARGASANQAPPAPTLLTPPDGSVATTSTPVYSWAASSDPEGETVTYDLEVRDDLGALVGSISGVTATATSISVELMDQATYAWRARATDRSGASSAFSPDSVFAVSVPIDCPQVLVCEDRACSGEVCSAPCGEAPPEGCQATGMPGAGSTLAGIGLIVILRRRRRRSRA